MKLGRICLYFIRLNFLARNMTQAGVVCWSTGRSLHGQQTSIWQLLSSAKGAMPAMVNELEKMCGPRIGSG